MLCPRLPLAAVPSCQVLSDLCMLCMLPVLCGLIVPWRLAYVRWQGLFAISCVVLKVKRPKLPRTEFARPWQILSGFVLVGWGMLFTIFRSVNVFGLYIMYAVIISSVAFYTLRKRDLVLFLRRVLPKQFMRVRLGGAPYRQPPRVEFRGRPCCCCAAAL